jgi:GH25 family lysozyme M1 (1,4-beta-N-acetylmuramidase)
MWLILDLSKYNTVTDWNAVKKEVEGVILRVGYRGYGSSGKVVADTKFKSFAEGCKRVGLPFGVYFMSQAITEAEAKNEAVYSVANAKTYGATLPVFFDSEWSNPNHNGRADRLNKAQRTAVAKAFCKEVEKLGYESGVYASESWFNSHLNYNELTGYYIWVADYGKNTGSKVSSIALSKYDLHQYTSNGKVTGVSGRCDLSECYVDLGVKKSETVTEVKTEEVYDMPVIKKGSKGKAVKIWQIILGFTGDDVDGSFGKQTETATKNWQKAKGLTVDGVVGKNSWRAGLDSV